MICMLPRIEPEIATDRFVLLTSGCFPWRFEAVVGVNRGVNKTFPSVFHSLPVGRLVAVRWKIHALLVGRDALSRVVLEGHLIYKI